MKNKQYWEDSLNNCFQKHNINIQITDKLIQDIVNISMMEDEYSGIMDIVDKKIPT